MSEGKLQTEKYIIGYIDLLGSSEKIRGDDSDYWLNVVNTLYNDAWNHNGRLKEIYTQENPSIKVFSDNILIAEIVDSHGGDITNSIYRILYFLSYIQSRALIDYQWLVRGCVSVGDLYIQKPDTDNCKSFIWGKGLVDAYDIESHVALYPRIIVDKSVFSLTPNWYMKHIIANSRYALEDKDGMFYLNYLEVYFEEVYALENNHLITQAFDVVSKMAEEDKERDSIAQKIAWTQNYLTMVQSDWELRSTLGIPVRYLDTIGCNGGGNHETA